MSDIKKYEIAARALTAAPPEPGRSCADDVVDLDLDVSALQEVARTSALVDELAELYRQDSTRLPATLRAKIESCAPPARPRYPRYAAIAAGFLLCVVCAYAFLSSDLGNGLAGGTPVPRTVMLDDGSTVLLNANSKIKAEYTATERRVKLVYGQAYFRVAKHKNRPFVVSTPAQEFKAVGTEFDLKYRNDSIKLIVTEGAVALVDATTRRYGEKPQSQGSVAALKTVSANQSALLLGGNVVISPMSVVEVEEAVAWKKGFVYFNDAPISRIVEEMNYHIPGKIIILDPEVGDFRSGGVYRIGHERELIAAMKQTLPIQSVQVTAYLTLLKSRAD